MARAWRLPEAYGCKSSYYGETAFNQTAHALMPAVQNLNATSGAVIRSRNVSPLVRVRVVVELQR